MVTFMIYAIVCNMPFILHNQVAFFTRCNQDPHGIIIIGELPLRAGHGLQAPIFLLLVRLSSSFNMLVQMCASFSYQSIKSLLLFLPPVVFFILLWTYFGSEDYA